MVHDTLDAIAARIQAAWEAGRICALVGRGCRARVVRVARLAAAGRLSPAEALQLAREAEALALCFLPLPVGDDL
ncbi:hypothetical protein [Methylobacterium ajmalii]|jgi:hypothetical protein|uniref:hypothetical protein n=1 Tax=Methylobacterium ajmalii TaxID=2738439 RepID=UPI00190BDD1E|nr:hypothetical protein [Methylobacterium ajmalii]MBK3398060.1 hypothetical protein [Methylobacterium ajmalii]MBK3406908.1 hypothetical protein [Methylobacterium ajmalii]MBK3422638.1 hypothetical protein [Methylobacterium ajmalii]MBZ6416711.1 hypothetical protein [Methylobacterium sp.]